MKTARPRFWRSITIHQPFGHAVLRTATGRDVDADSIEASLQVLTPAGRRVDLELVGRARGAVVRVWIEAKWDAGWQPGQLAHYTEVIGVAGALVALVPAHRAVEVPEEFSAPLTWEQVAVLADQAGIQEGGHRWRTTALQPDATARQRVLALFLEHLEREHHMTILPLLTEDALAIRYAEDAITIADELAEQAIRRAGLHTEQRHDFKRRGGAYWKFPAQPQLGAVWHPGGWAELMRSPTGAHQLDGPPEPVFLCGYTLPKTTIEWLQSDDLQDWRAELATEPLRFVVTGGRKGHTRVFTALPLAALATLRSSFDGQTQVLTDWMQRALRGEAFLAERLERCLHEALDRRCPRADRWAGKDVGHGQTLTAPAVGPPAFARGGPRTGAGSVMSSVRTRRASPPPAARARALPREPQDIREG